MKQLLIKLTLTCLILTNPLTAMAEGFLCRSQNDTGLLQFQIDGGSIAMCTLAIDSEVGGTLFDGESGVGERVPGAPGAIPFEIVTPLRTLKFTFSEDDLLNGTEVFTLRTSLFTPSGFGPRVPPYLGFSTRFNCIRNDAPLSCDPSVFEDPPHLPKNIKPFLWQFRELAKDQWEPLPTITLVSPDRESYVIAVFDGARADLHSDSGGMFTNARAGAERLATKLNVGWVMIPVYTNALGESLAKKLFYP